MLARAFGRGKPPTPHTFAEVVACGDTWTRSRECTIELLVDPVGTYVVAATTFEPGEEGEFTLRALSPVPLRLRALQPFDQFATEVVTDGAWSPGAAGGSLDEARWWTNPQYELVMHGTPGQSLRC